MNQECFAGFGVSLDEKTAAAIELLMLYEPSALSKDPEHGYWLAFSGGKDSCVIKELARMSGVKFRAVYNQTTIDPPELVRFIKEKHPDVQWRRPKRNFFRAFIDSHGPPTRLIRWCCEEFKEGGGDGLVKILGVRRAESVRRKNNWSSVTMWRSQLGGFCVNPIAYWSDSDVWRFIHQHNLPYCSLYDEGWKRLGCIGCPMAGAGRRKEFERWPGFAKAWRWAFNRYCEHRFNTLNQRTGKPRYIERFKTADTYFNWWMSDNPSPKDDGEACLGLYDGDEAENYK